MKSLIDVEKAAKTLKKVLEIAKRLEKSEEVTDIYSYLRQLTRFIVSGKASSLVNPSLINRFSP